ncbi:MAG: hypothetical protein NWS58_05170 [Pontimonas sp.]|nr:hypothetical protein [Pontimonas sp.]
MSFNSSLRLAAMYWYVLDDPASSIVGVDRVLGNFLRKELSVLVPFAEEIGLVGRAGQIGLAVG